MCHDQPTGLAVKAVASVQNSRNEKELDKTLQQSIDVIQGLNPDFESFIDVIATLKNRLEGGIFHLAVLGQFKRGKSTLLNALLGEAVLPTSVVPLTAIPTFIRSGNALRARVFFQEEQDTVDSVHDTAKELNTFLARYVTEEGNSHNRLGVSQVEVFYPTDVLRKGLVLIDTPGIGSTFRHNTEATLNFLPQCDAVLFLVSADPPITEVEVDFLKKVRKKVTRLFFILNKVDYLDTAERKTTIEFLKKVLVEQADIPADTRVFCVSARQALEARLHNDQELWRSSGLADVEKHLLEFMVDEKSAALRQAVVQKAEDIISEVLMRLRLYMRSLEVPLDELRDRMNIFEKKIEVIRQQRLSAGDLLDGDRIRTHEFLEEHVKQLRSDACDYLEGVARETIAGNASAAFGRNMVTDAVAEAIPGYFERVMGNATALLGNRMEDVLLPHQARAENLIESIRKTASGLFDIPYHAPESHGTFEVVRKPYWVTHKWSSTFNPIHPGALDSLFPSAMRKKRLWKRLRKQITDLVMYNTENIRWALFQSIDQTFLRYGSSLDSRLEETMSATYGAIRIAMEKRLHQEQSVQSEIEGMRKAERKLDELNSLLEPESVQKDIPHSR